MLSGNFIIAQILGFVATLLLCLSYIVKKKEKFLLLGVIGDLVYGLSFVFVNSLGTGIITMLSCLQSFAFYLFEKKNHEMPKWLAAIFAITFVVVGAMTATSYWDIVPIMVYVWYTFALYVKDIAKIRIMYVIPNMLLVAYDIVVTAYASAFEDGFEATFLTTIIVANYIKSRKVQRATKKCATLKLNTKSNWNLGAKGLQSAIFDLVTSDNRKLCEKQHIEVLKLVSEVEYPIPPS